MEFKIRKSEVGFEYFLRRQISSIEFVIRRDKSYPISEDERVGMFARAVRLKELYDLFVLSLDPDEIMVVEYLRDPTPVTHKKRPQNFESHYKRAYEKWIDTFFGNNANELPRVNYKTLGKLLRYYRKENNLSLSDLGEMLEIDGSAISRYEKGKRKPSIDLVYAFCGLMNIEFELLLKQCIK